jgi:undecaprenyl-diphosphatase
MNGPAGRWEERVLRAVAGTEPVHPGLVKAVTALGSRPAAYTITAGCALAAARRAHARIPATAARLLGTLAAGDLARELLCRAVARPRPPAELRHGHYTGFSFPSRHATLAALTAAAVIEVAPASGRRAAAAGALTVCAAVGASRLRLGVHWPTDVVAGYVFAAGWAMLGGRLAPLPQLGSSQYS